MTCDMTFSNATLPNRAKRLLFFSLLIQIMLGIGLIYSNLIFIPYIVLFFIHTYCIFQLIRSNKQVFYILLGSDTIFFVYLIITKNSSVFLYLSIINFVLLSIIRYCIHPLWKKF